MINHFYIILLIVFSITSFGAFDVNASLDSFEITLSSSFCVFSISFFNLSKKHIDELYSCFNDGYPINKTEMEHLHSYEDNFSDQYYTRDYEGTVKVVHLVWKALREFKFLTYLDKEGKEQTTVVDEDYVLNKNNVDISLYTECIPEVY